MDGGGKGNEGKTEKRWTADEKEVRRALKSSKGARAGDDSEAGKKRNAAKTFGRKPLEKKPSPVNEK